MIRDATFDDLRYLLPLAKLAHSRSVYRDMDMNEATMQRNFVVSMSFDDGYAKVVEKDGAVVGGLCGIIADNHYGIRCAQDLFNYSKCSTDRLIKDFLLWASVRDVRFVQITDMSYNGRYGKLCQHLGLTPAGQNYVKVA